MTTKNRTTRADFWSLGGAVRGCYDPDMARYLLLIAMMSAVACGRAGFDEGLEAFDAYHRWASTTASS